MVYRRWLMCSSWDEQLLHLGFLGTASGRFLNVLGEEALRVQVSARKVLIILDTRKVPVVLCSLRQRLRLFPRMSCTY